MTTKLDYHLRMHRRATVWFGAAPTPSLNPQSIIQSSRKAQVEASISQIQFAVEFFLPFGGYLGYAFLGGIWIPRDSSARCTRVYVSPLTPWTARMSERELFLGSPIEYAEEVHSAVALATLGPGCLQIDRMAVDAVGSSRYMFSELGKVVPSLVRVGHHGSEVEDILNRVGTQES